MKVQPELDVIIVGGSYAGLSAAMGLGRALRNVLIIDASKPCNKPTPHSHNLITHDGSLPHEISALAKTQVLKYDTVRFWNDTVTDIYKAQNTFTVETSTGRHFTSKKLIFATGLKDIMTDIPGLAACWGISVIHCPYCHGYEYKKEKTGIIANGDMAFHYGKLISNWTSELTIFTNGTSTLTPEQTQKLADHNIQIITAEIESLSHENGYLKSISLKDGFITNLKAAYASIPFEQHSTMPVKLGCELTEMGLLKVDNLGKTNIKGIFACGDNSNMRSLSVAIASGSMAAAALNFELIDDTF